MSWARHYQDTWQERAGDPRLPYWLRVTALAYGSHADNGHARFKRGEIGLILGAVDRGTGAIRPYEHVRRAIAVAVEFGWLEDGSYWGCLIVPAHAVKKGSLMATTPCPLAGNHAARRAKRPPGGRKRLVKLTPGGRFEARTGHSVAGSQRETPLSVLAVTGPGKTSTDTSTDTEETCLNGTHGTA